MQTSYSIEHGAAYVGTRADSAPMQARAGVNRGGGEIAFGRGVTINPAIQGLGPNSHLPIMLPAVAADPFVGVLVHDMAHERSAADGIAVGEVGSVVTKGGVYVIAEDPVGPGLPVYLRVAANGPGTAPGQFRATADGINTVLLAGAQWRGQAIAGGIVALEINLP
jgi:hypothetical protein